MGEKDERLIAVYNHKNIGKHMHHGFSTGTKYGWIGGGSPIHNGVFKADIRAREDLYLCGNCRMPFTVTRTEVYCGNCNQGQLDGLRTGRKQPTKAVTPAPKIIEEPKELPPPPDVTIDEPEEMVAPTDLNDLEFGGKRHDFIAKLLRENGIWTDVQAIELGIPGLVRIKGIGQKTAEDVYAAAESNALS